MGGKGARSEKETFDSVDSSSSDNSEGKEKAGEYEMWTSISNNLYKDDPSMPLLTIVSQQFKVWANSCPKVCAGLHDS